jgi:hypothetical protein
VRALIEPDKEARSSGDVAVPWRYFRRGKAPSHCRYASGEVITCFKIWQQPRLQLHTGAPQDGACCRGAG